MKRYQDKGWLEKKYITERLFTTEMGKICRVNPGTIWYWLKKYGIKINSIGEAIRGTRHHQWGKPIPEEQKEKQRKALKGRIRTEEHCRNLSAALKGRRGPLAGKKLTEMHRNKIAVAHFGKPMLQIRGSNHPNWKGGITTENHKLRTSIEFKKWRKAVFERDRYTCQKCSVKSGNGKAVCLHAHHILPFSNYPERRFDINNGLTLCRECHLG
jgi:hypothetical protein